MLSPVDPACHGDLSNHNDKDQSGVVDENEPLGTVVNSKRSCEKGKVLSMELSTRHEIVGLIDVEPTLIDYLLLHGVLTPVDVTDILEELEPVRQNQRLLELVEARSDVAGVQLLTNVLRQTGQHYLANLLDDGARIKALSGSGYLSKSRHKGQVDITIRITSMLLPSDPQLKAVSSLLGTDWISLEDIQNKMSSLKRSQRLSVAHPDAVFLKNGPANDGWPSDNADELESSCCCCCRCCCVNKTQKVSSKKYDTANTNMNSNPGNNILEQHIIRELNKIDNSKKNALVVKYQPGQIRSASVECVAVSEFPNEQLGNNLNSLRQAADNVQVRCTAIYSKVNEIGTPLRVAVERYFEQDRGILVLNTECLGAGSGVTVRCICTLPEHVQKLRKDHSTRVTTDLEQAIGTASGTLVRLEVLVDDNELDLVEIEMNSR